MWWCSTVHYKRRSLYLQHFDKGQQTVLQCPLVVRVENQRLQQLQDSQNITEEGQMGLLSDLMQVQVDAPMQECSDHGQVSEKHKQLKYTFRT